MCGIVGIYNFKRDDPVDSGLIRKMCSVLNHRGPDDEGIFCKEPVGLGHRRLSIIDPKLGRQPMSNEDQTLWIVFNGEIYNFLSLRDDLINRGHIFKTRCDTEVIIHLYEEKGVSCLDDLNGMFAFAVWDEKKQSIFLARDRLGKKPLHYAFVNGSLIFASEIKAILQHPSVKKEIDYEALHDYLSLSYVPAPRTMFKGIKKLPAGHYLVCTQGEIESKGYWDLDFSKESNACERDVCEDIRFKLKKAVKSRLISDVPLGAFLSGGVDSSSVVSLMSGLQDEPVITNSIGFSVKSFDELKYARLIAKRYSTDHHEYVVRPETMEVIDKLTYYFDEPFGDSSSIPTYHVSRMARRNVTVALSGDGGDENFAGYNRYVYADRITRFQAIMPRFLKERGMFSPSGFSKKDGGWLGKIKNKLDEFCLPPFDLYFKIISTYGEEEKHYLYGGKLKEAAKDYNTREKFRSIFDRCQSDDFVSKLQYLDIKTYLCDDILVKVDRASMANSLEVRAPFLDYSFMEFTAGIPSRYKLKWLTEKYVLKKAMSKYLPAEILRRPKMGFTVPMEEWLKNDLRVAVEIELFDKEGIIRELFDPEYIRKIWGFVLKGRMIGSSKTDFSYRIWLLFIFSRWFKRYVKNG
ncbi:MAG: asparagine synthase (glutamine-hydrolyzing) [Candidatus Omnitrophica bacterium]|nr:asparagine synthase (glutamine-hydrolyzing) [Candidatus Omnitrophota bacterium]